MIVFMKYMIFSGVLYLLEQDLIHLVLFHQEDQDEIEDQGHLQGEQFGTNALMLMMII